MQDIYKVYVLSSNERHYYDDSVLVLFEMHYHACFETDFLLTLDGPKAPLFECVAHKKK